MAATERERDMLAALLAAFQRAEHDLQVAFSMFARAHDLPDATVLQGVGSDGVSVQVPD